MAVIAAAHATNALSSDVVDTIIGGTMLTLALTRPRLRWVEGLDDSHRSRRCWAERALTGFSFAMSGYAAAAVWIALYGQLGAGTDALLKGTACFLAIYAGLVHFEPFVTEWNLAKGFSAVILYVGFAVSTLVIGAVIATFTLTSSVSVGLLREALLLFVVCVFGAWLVARFLPDPHLAGEESGHPATEAARSPPGSDDTDEPQ